MNSVQCLSFVFSLIVFSSVQSQEVCDFADDECVKKGTSKLVKKTVAGVRCVVEPSDPLYLDNISETTLRGSRYTIINATLVGFKNCEVTRMSINEQAMTYINTLMFPKLVLSNFFDLKGNLSQVEIDGKGFSVLTATDFMVTINGKFKQYISKKDHKPHLFITSYKLKTKLLGKIMLETDDLNEDKEKAKEALAYENENSETILLPFFRKPIIKEAISILIKRLNKVLRTEPVNEVFPKED